MTITTRWTVGGAATGFALAGLTALIGAIHGGESFELAVLWLGVLTRPTSDVLMRLGEAHPSLPSLLLLVLLPATLHCGLIGYMVGCLVARRLSHS